MSNKALYPFCTSGMEIFQSFSPNELEDSEKIACRKTYQKGSILFMPGEQGSFIYVLKQGRVKLSEISFDGKILTLAILSSGSIFGELALSREGTYELLAEAIEDSVVCLLNKEDLKKLIQIHPEVALKIIETIGIRLRHTHERLQDLAFKGVTGRLASLILQLVEEERENSHKKVYLPAKFTQQQLADMIGASREAVNHTLTELKRKNLININSKQIEIINKEGLEELKHSPRYSRSFFTPAK